MELDAMATERWLLPSCEWTEAVEEGGEYQAELLLKRGYYYSQSVFLSILCILFFNLFTSVSVELLHLLQSILK